MKAPFVIVQAALLCTFFVKANADPYEKIWKRVNHGLDDTEEYGYVPGGDYAGVSWNGKPQYTASSDLELGSDFDYYSTLGPQVVGIRIETLGIPKGAKIKTATLTFHAKDSSTGNSPDLLIKAVKGNQERITAQTRITDKHLTSAAATWNNLPNWHEGDKHNSPDLKDIVQEVIDSDTWTRGGGIMFVIRGDSTYYTPNKRRAYSYNGDPAKAPSLKVEFTTYGVRPCVVGETNSPQGCHPRIKKCEEFEPYEYAGAVVKETDTNCATTPTLASFIKGDLNSPQNLFFVKFKATNDPINGQCYGVVMRGGECWGTNPINNGNYDCQGSCGGGCGNWYQCRGWGFDCLRHDACSWFYGATGANCDLNCGDEFVQAQDDWWSNTNCGFSECGVIDLWTCPGTPPPIPSQTSQGGGGGGRRALEVIPGGEVGRVKKENTKLRNNARELFDGCVPYVGGTGDPDPNEVSQGGGGGGR